METQLDFQTAPDSSLFSPSSSQARVVPLPNRCLAGTRSPAAAGGKRRHLHENGVASVAGLAIQRLRFVDQVEPRGGEWMEVEARFDRVASTPNGSEPVVNDSDFNFCIGMQQTPEFANELLRALRGRRDRNAMITKKELQDYWCCITDSSFNSRMQIFFNMCDKNMDGRISEKEIKQALLLSASTNKLSMKEKEAQEYAALIMKQLDTQGRGFIEIFQLETLLFKSHGSNSSNEITKTTTPRNHNDIYQEPKSTAEILFRTYWRRIWVILLWLVACFTLFGWKFSQYRHRSGFEVMGYCLCTAKGAAETLKLNMALILLPVCRNTMTWLRNNHWISSIAPFNDNINFHKLIAGGIVIGVILHGGTHLACDFPRITGIDRSIFRRTIAAGFGNHQPSYCQILATTEVATGLAMVILMAIAFSLAVKWPRRSSPVLPRSVRRVTGFNTFWYSHHLFILVYALLIVHSLFLFLTDEITEKTTWMYIAIPILLYVGERTFRALRSRYDHVEILKATLHPGKVLLLKFSKPENFKYRSGMYIYIQCPQISSFEWHPFSLTSGPEDDYLSVHIRSLGDWSYLIYNLFQEAIVLRNTKYPKVFIDGPYGAASQDYVKYDIVVLIGLGIGATPFISILKDVMQHFQKPHYQFQIDSRDSNPKKAYLYWVTREQSSFEWFRDFLDELSMTDQKQNVIEMHNFLTSVYRDGDARSALITAVQALYLSKNGIDIVSQTPVRTHFGRPNWFKIFSDLANQHGGVRIGLFYCGPTGLGRELERMCTKFSTNTTTRFVFHKETY